MSFRFAPDSPSLHQRPEWRRCPALVRRSQSKRWHPLVLPLAGLPRRGPAHRRSPERETEPGSARATERVRASRAGHSSTAYRGGKRSQLGRRASITMTAITAMTTRRPRTQPKPPIIPPPIIPPIIEPCVTNPARIRMRAKAPMPASIQSTGPPRFPSAIVPLLVQIRSFR